MGSCEHTQAAAAARIEWAALDDVTPKGKCSSIRSTVSPTAESLQQQLRQSRHVLNTRGGGQRSAHVNVCTSRVSTLMILAAKPAL
eukprot:1159411-Pelagomonas_calceolata.AAC.3